MCCPRLPLSFKQRAAVLAFSGHPQSRRRPPPRPPCGELSAPSRRRRSLPGPRSTASGPGAGAQRAGGGRCGLGAGTERPGRTRLFPLPSRPPRVVSPGSREETERSGSTALGPQSSGRAEQSQVAPPERRAATHPGRLCLGACGLEPPLSGAGHAPTAVGDSSPLSEGAGTEGRSGRALLALACTPERAHRCPRSRGTPHSRAAVRRRPFRRAGSAGRAEGAGPGRRGAGGARAVPRGAASSACSSATAPWARPAWW